TPGATYNSSQLTAAWTYFQAQGSPQATWQAFLLDGSSNVIEGHSGTTETTVPFTTVLADGATYTVQVFVTSAAGLTSAVGQPTLTGTYLPPADVAVAASYDADSGSMVLTVTGDGAVDGVTVAINTVTVQRQINGGPWVTLATGLMLAGTPLTVILVDTTPT